MSVSDVCVQYVQGTDHRNIWTFVILSPSKDVFEF